jgi:DNA-binding protein YbaB
MASLEMMDDDLLLSSNDLEAGSANDLLSQAVRLKAQHQKLQRLLQEIRVTGESKNSKVVAIITGEQKIVDIMIDPLLIKLIYESLLNDEDEDDLERQQEAVQNLISRPIIEAVDDAIGKVQSEVVRKIQETGSLVDLMSMLQAVGK